MVFVSKRVELMELVRYYPKARCGSFRNINTDTVMTIKGYTYSRLEQIQLKEEE